MDLTLHSAWARCATPPNLFPLCQGRAIIPLLSDGKRVKLGWPGEMTRKIQRGAGRSALRGSQGWGLSPDAYPANRWMERKRSSLQSQSQNLSPRKLSEWPWGPRAQPLITASLLDWEPPEVRAQGRRLCPQHHWAQAQRRGSVKGKREMNTPLLPASLCTAVPSTQNTFLFASSQSSSSFPFWLTCFLLQEAYLDTSSLR